MNYGPNKVCIRCHKRRLIKFFVLSTKGYRHSYCKTCAAKALQEWSRTHKVRLAQYALSTSKRNRKLVDALKAQPCVDCKRVYPPCVMDFDHLPSFKKKRKISNMMSSQFSEKAILEEVAKCDVVCSNCHRLRTTARAQQHKLKRLRDAHGR